MYGIKNRQYLSVIATTGADIHVAVTWSDSGLGRGKTQTELTAITAISATPGTQVLAGPDTPSASKVIENITIRNIDTTSQTVTVCIVSADDAGTRTVFQLWSETLASGQELIYEDGAGWALETHNTLGQWVTLIAPADVANSANNVLANVTGLTYPVVTDGVYQFRAQIDYTAAATTTGSRWTVNGPAMTYVDYKSQYTLDATTETTNHNAALQTPAAANASSLTVGNTALLWGQFKPSADGTFAIQFASEVNASAITALAGATLEIRRVL